MSAARNFRLGGIPTGNATLRIDSKIDPNRPLLMIDFGPFRDVAVLMWPAGPTIDVIDVCSFPKDHAKQTIAAAKAGKHLIIEKPLGLNRKEVLAMADAIKAAKVKTCVCFEVRWSSQFRSIKGVIDAGLLGDVHFAEVDYFHGIGPWYGQFRWSHQKAEAGSSLLSAGCHAMDALLLCMGPDAVPAEVTSYSTSSKSEYFAPYDFPTTQISIVKFKDGRVGKTTSCVDCLQPYYFHTHVVGSHGSLLDDKFHSAKLGAASRPLTRIARPKRSFSGQNASRSRTPTRVNGGCWMR